MYPEIENVLPSDGGDNELVTCPVIIRIRVRVRGHRNNKKVMRILFVEIFIPKSLKMRENIMAQVLCFHRTEVFLSGR